MQTTLRWVLMLSVGACCAATSRGREGTAAAADQPRLRIQYDVYQARATTVAFQEPPEIHSAASILETDLNATYSAQDLNGVSVNLRNFNSALVGPTLRIKRGDTLKIHLHNLLTNVPECSPYCPKGDSPPHDFNTTNLHTHGLNVSPVGNADNVFDEITPGGTQNYEINVPFDHHSGTFWYHPHKHGAVAIQLVSGMAGALIVEGRRHDNLTDLEDVPEIRAVRERVFVLQKFQYSTINGTNCVDPNTLYPTTCPGSSPNSVWAVNGLVVPYLVLRPGEVERWRLIHAGIPDTISLTWADPDQSPTDEINFWEIALDGIATGELKNRPAVVLFPGNRSDVLVKAPDQPGTYLLIATPSLPGQPSNPAILATVHVKGPAHPMELPRADRLLACRPFPSVRPDEISGNPARTVEFELNGGQGLFHINNAAFDKNTFPFKPVLNTAEEWSLTATNGDHPFHTHVNPFQVVRETDQYGNVIRGEWRDTVLVQKGAHIKVRIRYRNFPGKTVFHCHNLQHEDSGMMQGLEIDCPPFANAVKKPQARAVRVGDTAPRWVCRDVNGRLQSSASISGRRAIVVFVLGLDCPHCVQQVRELTGNKNLFAKTGSRLIVFCSQPIDDLKKALAVLGWSSSNSETLLCVDTDHKIFRSFGCYTDEPLHGTFVLDRASRIRANRVGPAPWSDQREIAAALEAAAAR